MDFPRTVAGWANGGTWTSRDLEQSADLARGWEEVRRRIADLVTEARKVKHPFDEGVRAQRGIAW